MQRNQENTNTASPQQIDITNADQGGRLRDGDQLRDINSYWYLKNIADKMKELKERDDSTFLAITKQYSALDGLFKLTQKQQINLPTDDQLVLDDVLNTYDPKVRFPYGNFYSQFMADFEDEIEKKYLPAVENALEWKKKNPGEELPPNWAQFIALSKIINVYYANENDALKRAGNMLKSTFEATQDATLHTVKGKVNTRLKGSHIEKDKKSSLFDKLVNVINYYTGFRDVNEMTPQDAGSVSGRLKALLSPNFKPTQDTRVPFVKRKVPINVLNAKGETVTNSEGKTVTKDIVELSIGTQAQIHLGQVRVSPAFEAWIATQSLEGKKHVYINYLGLDRTGYEGEREKSMTKALHQLEEKYDDVYVITLPADKGFMDEKLLEMHAKSKTDAYNTMLAVATGQGADTENIKIRDFEISLKAKRALYGFDLDLHGIGYNAQNEKENMCRLLDKSFKKLGFDKNATLSPAEFQAVYFHFIKYELTNFILEKLQPSSFNLSCKDAIDRGGAASAYFHLMQWLEKKTPMDDPMDEATFNASLHALPALVKGRGMNEHADRVWNAVDKYVNNTENNAPNWLITWRNNHAPKHSRIYLMKKLEDYIKVKSENLKRSTFDKFDPNDKIKAAEHLQTALYSKDGSSLKQDGLTSVQWRALHDGKLGKILEGLLEHGHIKREKESPTDGDLPNKLSSGIGYHH